MNIIFVMSISGSIVFLLYLLTKPIANRYLTAHWQYNFLKICLLFYLVPYQCFQNKLLILYNLLFGTGEAVNPLRNDIMVFEAKNTIYITSDGRMHYKYWIPLLIFAMIWLCVITVSLYKQIKKYCSCRSNLMQFSAAADTGICDIAEQCNKTASSAINKRIRIIFCPFTKSPFTIGLFYPVIVLPPQNDAEDLSLYLSHELSHIRNHDTLWKFISFLTILIHWYNPLAYLLFYELCAACEKTCDEMVTESLDETQKIHYENLIIEAAQHQANIEPLYANTFSTSKRQTKERILFMTRKNRKSPCRKIIATLIICITALSVPISVLAYEPVKVYYDIQPYNPNGDVMYIMFNDAPCPLDDPMLIQLDFTLSDEIIIDECGNQYPITAGSENAARSCSHEYISGNKSYHAKNGNGCTMYIYEGTYCKKCHFCLQENLINHLTFGKCPH
ncbi:MAG: M56 family metallopeptidase [Lachnospiraceae bacterium]|nr:M56 family metallopeptidase [Lachnospiraceae bacterium]